MLNYPNIDPIAFHLGSFPVHWYGLMYLVGAAGGWVLLRLRLSQSKFPEFTKDQVTDLVFYSALGAIIGGRLGYVFFYDFAYLAAHPLFLFQTWKGGMSFHGGLIGVMVALSFCAIRMKKSWLELGDFIAPVVPIGLGAGRIGNFINSELWGRVTTSPFGMVFPNGGQLPRHPSQLYEFFLEGVVLFLILWFFSKQPKPRGAVSGLFLICYGVFRFSLEFFREPDVQIGFLAGGFTEGQLLSLPMIAAGLFLFIFAYRGELKKCSNI